MSTPTSTEETTPQVSNIDRANAIGNTPIKRLVALAKKKLIRNNSSKNKAPASSSATHDAEEQGSTDPPPPPSTAEKKESAPQSRFVKDKRESAPALTQAQSGSPADLLSIFDNITIDFATNRTISTYIPCSTMMYFIIHHMNEAILDEKTFRRNNSNFHPYVTRLYCGVLFWIQTLRVQVYVSPDSHPWKQFLVSFLQSHPLSSLTIPSPLLPLFMSICASAPELREYGNVTPILPTEAGPATRSLFIRNAPESFALPNIPGIFALLKHYDSIANPVAIGQNLPAAPIYPKMGCHIPVGATAQTFGNHVFPDEGDRTAVDRWSLVTPGLEYPCEADEKMNEVFAERYRSFRFPTTAGTDVLTQLPHFLGLNGNTEWFTRITDVMSHVSKLFKNSGTLADCPPIGPSANQFVTMYMRTPAALPTPTFTGDENSLFPLSFRLATSARTLDPAIMALAGYSQTNVTFPLNHPYAPTFGQIGVTRHGSYWALAPLEFSEVSENDYQKVRSIIRGLVDHKAQ